MPKALTDTQRVILANAASRPNHRALPTPSTLNKNAGAIALSMRALLTNGLISEKSAEPGDVTWSTSEENGPSTLIITVLGLSALGLNEDAIEEDLPVTGARRPAASAAATKAGSKLAIIIERLSHSEGATIEQLAEVTGWQKHSVRGAMSGALKRARHLTVTSELVDGRSRVYRIAAAAAQAPSHQAADDRS